MKKVLLALVATAILLAACSAHSKPVVAGPVTPTPSGAASIASVPSTVAPATTALPAPVGSPTHIAIQAINVDEAIKPVTKTFTKGNGCDDLVNGCLIPPSGDVLYWYRASDKGNMIITGHDIWSDAQLPFWNLYKVPAGASIVVTYSSGQTVRLVAKSGKSELKTDVQADQTVWGQPDHPQWVIVTCDPRSLPLSDGHRQNNFVLYAELAPT